MKLLLLSLLALCPLMKLQAQNWRPVQPGYVYQYDDSEGRYFNHRTGINHLRIISKGVENGDSVYYLNPVSRNGIIDGNLIHRYGIALVKHGIAVKNQPYFLGKKVRISSGNWIFDEKIKIIPHAALGDKWSFYTSGDTTIQAEVTRIQKETFLKITDDVKTISLSNGDTIKLSKNHGIIWFPYFNAKHNGHRLQGVDGPNIGLVIPLTNKIFDFQPGDIYQYQHKDNNVTNVGEYVRQVIILQRMESATNISYKVREITLKNGKVSKASKFDHYSLSDPAFGLYPDEFSVDNNLGLPFNKENNSRELIYTMDSHGGYYYWEPTNPGSDTIIPIAPYNSCPSAEERNYVIGLGMTYSLVDNMGGKWEIQLTAYRKTDGRSSGTLLQIDTTTGVKTIAPTATKLQVYPNPANGETMTVTGQLSRPVLLQFTLTDLQGRAITTSPTIEVPTGEFRQNIDISQVSAGIYLLKVTGSGIRETMRLSVVR